MRLLPGKRISKFILTWISPLGWLLLIIWYVVNLMPAGGNVPPIIHGIEVSPSTVQTGQTASVRVHASDPDGDEIHYFWGSALGRIQLDRFQDDQCTYVAPDLPGVDFVWVTAYDDKGAEVEGFEIVTIAEGGTD